MFDKVLEKLTDRDDLERVAYKGDIRLLEKYLLTRRLWFPIRPSRFLDAGTFTAEELLELTEQESKRLAGNQFELWTLEVEEKSRLPAFSNQKRMEAFSAKMSLELNKVFSLDCIEALLSEIVRGLDVDFIDLNLFSRKSWEIGVTPKNRWQM